MTRIIWLSLFVLCGIIVFVLMRMPQAVTVQSAQAERKSIQSYVEERAKTRLPEIYRITMPLQGRILPITLKEGDRVSAGQVVARMDTDDLETELLDKTNQVQQVLKSIEGFDNAIRQLALTVAASRAKVDYAKLRQQRLSKLSEGNSRVTTKTDLEQAELDLITSRIDLQKDRLDEVNYTIARTAMELYRQTQESNREKAHRDRQRGEITSPVNGIVLHRNESNERVLAPGEVLLELGSLEALEIEADVLSQEVVRIEIGDRVDVEGAAVNVQPVAGFITRIFPRGFTKISSLGVEQQRVKVLIGFADGVLGQLKQNGRQLGADYRVRVRIHTQEKEDAIVIPRSALFRGTGGQWQVFVIREQQARLADVEIGLANDFEVEITSGVAAGDRVVIAPESTLSDGQLVEED